MENIILAALAVENKFFSNKFQPADVVAVLFIFMSAWLFKIGEITQGKEIILIVLGYYFGRQNVLVTRNSK